MNENAIVAVEALVAAGMPFPKAVVAVVDAFDHAGLLGLLQS